MTMKTQRQLEREREAEIAEYVAEADKRYARDPHPQQAEGVRLGSGVVTPWVKPSWPSNYYAN